MRAKTGAKNSKKVRKIAGYITEIHSILSGGGIGYLHDTQIYAGDT